MADQTQPSASPSSRRRVIVAFALWPLLWSAVPALIVWSVKPYLRGPTFSFEGRSHAELEAELNDRYAVKYLVLGGLLGLAGGVVSLWLRREWQVFVLSVAVGVLLVVAFVFHIGPPYDPLASMVRHAVWDGGLTGLLLGLPLGMAHRRARSRT
jgi:hypothetical protein